MMIRWLDIEVIGVGKHVWYPYRYEGCKNIALDVIQLNLDYKFIKITRDINCLLRLNCIQKRTRRKEYSKRREKDVHNDM